MYLLILYPLERTDRFAIPTDNGRWYSSLPSCAKDGFTLPLNYIITFVARRSYLCPSRILGNQSFHTFSLTIRTLARCRIFPHPSHKCTALEAAKNSGWAARRSAIGEGHNSKRELACGVIAEGDGDGGCWSIEWVEGIIKVSVHGIYYFMLANHHVRSLLTILCLFLLYIK